MTDILGILNQYLGTGKRFAHNEYYFYCPFCHHKNPKLAVNLDKGAWHCWVCNQSGYKLVSLLRRLDCPRTILKDVSLHYNEEYKSKINDTDANIKVFLPREYVPLWIYDTSYEYKQAIRYLSDRGITPHDIVRYQIGICKSGLYAERFVVPSFDDNNQLNYFVARSYYPEVKLKYKNPPVSKDVVGFENTINWKFPVVLCEGVFDAMAIKQNAIPLFGKSLPSSLLTKLINEHVEKVYVALDKDAESDAIKMINELKSHKIDAHLVKMEEKDPAEIGYRSMYELIQNAKKLTFADLVKHKLR